ncbi:MAG: DSBA-like thioredoxin domain protein [bacterium]|nr:DSBA-like thioredoxin domain protein [bacterium]
MRALLAGVVLLAVVPARAADGTLGTGVSHEVVWTPPTPVPIRGPRFAPVTLDAYVALGHPPSYASAEIARRWAEKDPSVRAVLHLFAYGIPAELAMEALLEAADEGRFFALFDRYVQSRMTFGGGTADLARVGREAGLDGARLDEALASHRHRGELERLQREARAAGHHPPELLVNGRRVSPWSGDEAIGKNIGEARTRAEELLADGVPLSQLYERIVELDEEVPFEPNPPPRGPHRRLAIELGSAPTRGPTTAPITIVVWANFACMQCVEVAAALKRLDETHPRLVRVAWKHFPSPYRAQNGQTAAEYAAAAQAQGRFWPLYDLVMSSHLVPARVSRSELDRLGAMAKLDDARLKLELDSGRARAAVEHDTEEARRLGVPSAGAVAVNGIPVGGVPSYETLERLVAAELDAGVLDRLRRH